MNGQPSASLTDEWEFVEQHETKAPPSCLGPLQSLSVSALEHDLVNRMRELQRNTPTYFPRVMNLDVTPQELEILQALRRQQVHFDIPIGHYKTFPTTREVVQPVSQPSTAIHKVPRYALGPIPNKPGPYANSSLEASTSLLSMEKLHIPEADREWCTKVNIAVAEFHKNIDCSHNYEHIQRVCAIALRLYEKELTAGRASTVDPRKLFVALMVHDVGDSKYVPQNRSSEQMTKDLLARSRCPTQLIGPIWTIVKAVSWSGENKDPISVQAVIRAHPELAFVQDADRIDGMGAAGIARCFAYGGAAIGLRYKSLDRGAQLIWTRFRSYLTTMKTVAGREEAFARWPEMEIFWNEYVRETDVSNVLD